MPFPNTAIIPECSGVVSFSVEIRKCGLFYVRLLLLGFTSVRLAHIIVFMSFFLVETISYMTTPNSFSFSPLDWCLVPQCGAGCYEHACLRILWRYVFISFRFILGNGFTGSRGWYVKHFI